MNTAFLSAIPAAPPQEQPVPPRAAKSGRPVIATDDSAESASIDESEPQSGGDTDKADAFAEMLAAMISVATPAVETHVETVQPAAVDSVTSTATDIPRDGAGSPLFSASFMTSSPAATEVSAATTSNSIVESGIAAGPVGAEANQMKAAATTSPGSEISEAAVAELAGLDAGAREASPEAASLTVDVEGSSDVIAESTPRETAEVGEGAGESELPVIEAHESNVASGDVRHDAVDGGESFGDQAVKTESPKTPSRFTDAKAPPAKTDAIAPQAETSVDSSAAELNQSAVSEAPKAESTPVATPEPVAQNKAQVDEPYEAPVEPRADLEESATVKSASSRKSSSNSARAVAGVAPESAEPEVANAVTAVESSAAVVNGKDVVRERAADPVVDTETPAAMTLDSDGIVSMGAGEIPAAQSAAGIATTHTDSTAAATPSHVSQQVLQALAAYEAQLPQGGTRSFEMLLDPPELGRLLVQMSRTSKGVDVRISAENETVRSILEITGGELQQSLQLAGFDLGQFSGSSSGEAFANGEEWVSAPSLQSFASRGSVQSRSNTTHNSGTSAVNVMV